MSLYHAVVCIDHESAQILKFGAGQSKNRTLHSHTHTTRQHGSQVRTEHEFYGQVCDEMDGIAEILVAGGHVGLADFRHYVNQHRPHTAQRITGYEVVDHPSDNALLALARRFFVKYDQMVGIALPH